MQYWFLNKTDKTVPHVSSYSLRYSRVSDEYWGLGGWDREFKIDGWYISHTHTKRLQVISL